MELCHWPFRKAKSEDHSKLIKFLLEGRNISAKETTGWMVDYVGSMNETLDMAWQLVTDGKFTLPKRKLEEGVLKNLIADVSGVKNTDNSTTIAARKAILNNIKESCRVTISEALEIQARNSGNFMTSKYCQYGFVGSDYKKKMLV